MTAASMGDVLHEREAELDQLGHAVARAAAGQGAVVLVEGAPGIGKTRLLDEACRMAAGRARVLRARGGEQERDIPLLVTRELFTLYVASAPGEEQDRVFAGAAALAGPLLGRGTAQAGVADGGFALVHGLYWLVANLADERPLALVVDDVHWVDEATQRWLGYLLPRLGELPVVLVMAVRPRELDPSGPLGLALAAVPDLVRVRPAALTEPATASALRGWLPGAADEFCAAVHRSTGGNPLLTRALVTATQERGLEPTADAARRIEEIGAAGLSRIVLPRLHALGPAAVDLARAVAIVGDGCAMVDAAEVAGLSREAAGSAYDGLVAADILRDPVAFTHPLVRAVVSDEIPPGTTAGLRLRAARVLRAHGADPEAVAGQLAMTDPVREQWAVEVLQQAAAVANGRGAPEAALRHLVTLLREDLDAESRCWTLLDAAQKAFRCADPRGLVWLDEALDLATDPLTKAIAWTAAVNWRAILLEGGDPVTGMPEKPEGEAALVVSAAALLDMGFSAAGLRTRPELRLDIEPPAGGSMAERTYLCSLAMDQVLTCGDADVCVDLVRRAWAGGQLLEESIDLAGPAWSMVAALAGGEIGLGLESAQAALDSATARGAAASVEWCVMGLGFGQLCAGDVVGAEATLVSWADEVGFHVPITRPFWTAFLVDTHRRRDRIDKAYEEAAATVDEWRDNIQGTVALNNRGTLHLTAGRFAEALADFERAGQILDSFAARATVMPAWRLGTSAALAALGRADEARALAEEQLADARRWGAAPLLGASLRTLATVVGGDEGLALAEQAVDVLAASEAAGEHTEALLVHGRLLRAARDNAHARDVLVQALDQAERQGALLLARLAEEELRMLGARPRRRAVAGVHALTPAELRVATLAAQGLSNPEIAQSLFVTRKTVEKHLGSAFGKLHVSSRDQLRAVMGAS